MGRGQTNHQRFCSRVEATPSPLLLTVCTGTGRRGRRGNIWGLRGDRDGRRRTPDLAREQPALTIRILQQPNVIASYPGGWGSSPPSSASGGAPADAGL